MTNPRRTHTDSERAQERLDVVSRQLDRARATVERKKAAHDDAMRVVIAKQCLADERRDDVAAAQADVTALEKRRDYLAQDPALPPRPVDAKQSFGDADTNESSTPQP